MVTIEEVRTQCDQISQELDEKGNIIEENIEKIFKRNKALGKFLTLEACTSGMIWRLFPEIYDLPENFQKLFLDSEHKGKRGKKLNYSLVYIQNLLGIEYRQARTYYKAIMTSMQITEWSNIAYRLVYLNQVLRTLEKNEEGES